MVEVRETRLPGVGKKFTMRTHRGDSVCAVLHLDGRREIYHREPEDEDEQDVLVLNDEEARQLGSILSGVLYRPELVRDLEVALEDLAIEWIDVPATSPLVGLTVATCRIRSTTGSSVIAILRKGGAMAMPHPDEVVQAGDTLVIIGRPEQFGAIQRLVAEGPPK
ncbi:MAG: hypothetical protein MUE51_12970 [Thermoleophilia bacterium]|jgi:TrkA domain protein|nr:hypothetical protein [Thermoleophilia bacterium]